MARIKLSHLPIELLRGIFFHTNKRDLANVAATCHHFLPMAYELLYRDIQRTEYYCSTRTELVVEGRNENLSPLPVEAIRWRSQLSALRTHAYLTRTLRLDFFSHIDHNADEEDCCDLRTGSQPCELDLNLSDLIPRFRMLTSITLNGLPENGLGFALDIVRSLITSNPHLAALRMSVGSVEGSLTTTDLSKCHTIPRSQVASRLQTLELSTVVWTSKATQAGNSGTWDPLNIFTELLAEATFQVTHLGLRQRLEWQPRAPAADDANRTDPYWTRQRPFAMHCPKLKILGIRFVDLPTAFSTLTPGSLDTVEELHLNSGWHTESNGFYGADVVPQGPVILHGIDLLQSGLFRATKVSRIFIEDYEFTARTESQMLDRAKQWAVECREWGLKLKDLKYVTIEIMVGHPVAHFSAVCLTLPEISERIGVYNIACEENHQISELYYQWGI